MVTIILEKDGNDLHVFLLLKARTTIGRRTYNDILIDVPGISGEHTVLVTSLDDVDFEDLGSTNGSQLNGQPLKKHFLRDGDVIELATHTIRYELREDLPATVASAKANDSSDLRQTTIPSPQPLASQPSAFIRILKGVGSGKDIPLLKTMTTVGRPGI